MHRIDSCLRKKEGDLDRAVECLQKSVSIDRSLFTTSPSTLLNLCATLTSMGKAEVGLPIQPLRFTSLRLIPIPDPEETYL